MSKKKKTRQLLPPKYQVPVTLAMAVVFVVVVYFRLGPGAKKASTLPATPPPAAATATAGTVALPASALGSEQGAAMVIQLNEAILQLKKAATAAAPLDAIPPLARNPFFPAEFELERVEMAEDEEALEPQSAPEPQPAPRVIEEEAPLPQLSGVLLQGKRSIAILDGEYYHRGERKGEFTVADIQERRVLLRKGDEQHWVEVVKPMPGAKPKAKPSAPATGEPTP